MKFGWKRSLDRRLRDSRPAPSDDLVQRSRGGLPGMFGPAGGGGAAARGPSALRQPGMAQLGEDDSGKNSVLAERWEVLGRMSEVSPSGGIGGKANEYKAHYEYAYKILTDPRFKKVLQIQPTSRAAGAGLAKAREKLAGR